MLSFYAEWFRNILIRLHRASWIQTELLLTFPPPILGSVTLIPRNQEETAGRFRVWLQVTEDSHPPHLLWDRKLEGGFPELKILECLLSCMD